MKYWNHDLLSNTVDEALSALHDATGLALSKPIGKLQMEEKVRINSYRVTRQYRKHFLGVLLTKILQRTLTWNLMRNKVTRAVDRSTWDELLNRRLRYYDSFLSRVAT